MSLVELTAIGKDLGLSGTELQNFVKEQQAIERADRGKTRQAEREAREAKQKELDTLVLLEAAKKETRAAGRDIDTVTVRSPLPKLQKFEEGKDDMDAFIERFERFAACQGWAEENWAFSLSPLLAGKGRQAYATMSANEANEYSKLKEVLLRSYDLNEEGYRQKFRGLKPEARETASQFMSKLQIYFGRWVEMSKVEKDYESLRDMMLKEQFLEVCHEELATFLKERMPELDGVEKLAHTADQYVDAHGCTLASKQKRKEAGGASRASGFKPRHQGSNEIKPQGNVGQGYGQGRPGQDQGGQSKGGRKLVECFYCHKLGHVARDCKAGQRAHAQRAASAQNMTSHGNKSADKVERTGTGAACQSAKEAITQCTEGESLRLTNGMSLPFVSEACDQHSKISLSQNMPVEVGYIGNQRVRVLRDTGCSSAAVRASLVAPDQMTEKVHLCVLIDGTIRRFPIAKLQVDTPYLTGEIEAMCMKDPICDLVIGNLPGARKAKLTPSAECEALGPGNRKPHQEQVMEIKAPVEKIRQYKRVVAPPPEGVQTTNGSDVSRANKGDASTKQSS